MLVFGFIASSINAQQNRPDFRDKFLFGIKAGANYSNVFDEQGDQFTADGKFGFVGGVFIDIPIGTFLGLQPEVLYSQKGFMATGNILGVPFKTTHTTTYIDIPLLICLKPSQYFTLMGGPQYSYLIKQKDSFTSEGLTQAQEEAFTNNNLRKNTLSVVGGFEINMEPIVFGARASWDLQTNNGDGSSSNPRYKNVWYQATLGIRF